MFNPFLGFDIIDLYESAVKGIIARGYTGIYLVYDEFSKYLEANIANAWQRREDPVPLYLLLIDANKFKQINDTFGHAEGDATLVKIADALRMACHGLPHRANIARYGGDEFVVLARVDGPEVIDRLTNCIHECLEKMNQGSPYPLTVSIGITKAAKGLTLESLLKEADAKLYQEKRR